MAKPKYVIYDKKIIMSLTDMHFELLPKEHKHELINGGGWWDINRDFKIVLFFSCSTDFGFAEVEDLIEAIQNTEFPADLNILGYDVYHSEKVKIEEAGNDMKPLNIKITK